MKFTTVRVTRTTEVTIKEYVDIAVSKEGDEHGLNSPKELAKDLVAAQMAAGQNIEWLPDSKEVKTYPRPVISASVLAEAASGATNV